ncbi:hypothetical protein [Streptomyces sp. NPDC057438]|uniref:hypothetical protein n=1 Tax=Streptomyces sp. NPDC057438 TaxID=3346133 RepID=UPI0036B21350
MVNVYSLGFLVLDLGIIACRFRLLRIGLSHSMYEIQSRLGGLRSFVLLIERPLGQSLSRAVVELGAPETVKFFTSTLILSHILIGLVFSLVIGLGEFR